MKLWGTRLFQTVVGKTIAGVVVVTVGVGAAAAGGADVPLLTSAAADEAEGTDDEVEDDGSDDDGSDDGVSDDDGSGGDGSGDDGSDDDGSGDDGSGDDGSGDDGSDDDGSGDDGSDDEAASESVGDDADDSEDTDETGDTDEPNHGEIVSTFTQETELTGCEKGQATAAVARGDVDPTSGDIDELLAPYLERCAGNGDAEPDSEETEASGEAADWKTTRDEGRAIRDEARQAFVDACGDDGESDVDADADADGDGDGDGMSSECAELHAAAKQAHEDWKAAWHAERDAAKGPNGPKHRAETDEQSETESGEASVPADDPGPPDHAKANGKQKDDQASPKGKGNGASKGNGKP